MTGLHQAVASPTIVSTVPTDQATGVSPGAAVKFTFSTAMDTNATVAYFSDVTADYESPDVVSVWNAGNTVLTCTPSPQFANNHEIDWSVDGQDSTGNYLAETTGSFTTVAGVNGGSGTNTLTTFWVSKYAIYQQTNRVPAILGYEFDAQTTLSSNRTATGVTVTIPTSGGISNLVENALYPEELSTYEISHDLTNFNTTFPNGNYVFNVSGSSAQQVTVNLPNKPYPNAAQITDFPAAQAINPAQPFTLDWNPFTNGTTADWILVEISDDSGNTLFQTLLYGQSGGLNGTARSVTIPAGTLPVNSTNSGVLIFAHVNSTTIGGTATYAIVGSETAFTVSTAASSTAGPAPRLTLIPSGTNVLLEWPTNATGYTLQFSTSLASSVWSTTLPAPVVINTNNVVTSSVSGTARFFRLSNP